jgi:6-phosphogluconolactonase
MSEQRLVFVGTYTEPILFGTGKILEGKGKGIHVFTLDVSSGAVAPHGLVQGVPNPSYLGFAPSHRYLYCVNELKAFEGAPTGAVSSFALDPDTGELTYLNTKPSHGTDPCHLTVDQAGKYAIVANFMSGSVSVLPIQADGSLGDAVDVIQHQGSSVDPIRQSGPHAHAVTLDPTGRYAFVPDLGLDQVMAYSFDLDRGKLAPADEPYIQVAPGAGPRQLALHPGGEYGYLINELDSTVTAFQYDGDKGTLRELQTVSTLPEGFQGASTCAEVQVSPSGRFLYGSNRGHDSIVAYAIDPLEGTLSCIGHFGTQGRTPRHFSICPDGRFLLVANQDTDNIVVFRLDPGSGTLAETSHRVKVPTPVCIKVL